MMKQLHLLSLFLLLGILNGYSQDQNIDVWDFGATQLDESLYNNHLTEDIINSWYDDAITPGTSGHVLPDFTAGVLSWVGGGNDRLRTVNTNLTRYDENINDHDDFKGRIYVNSSGKKERHLSLELKEGDEVTLWLRSQEGNSNIHFDYIADSSVQDDVVAVGKEPTELNFTATATGTYHIYDDTDKPSYFRVTRKSAAQENGSGDSNNLVKVWDFGATQLDESQFENMLTEDVINSWYANDITPGSAGNVMPDFTAGALSWVGGGNDRLRTVNTNLTRYDENINDHDDFKGRIYVNSSGKTDRYLRLELIEGDEVTLWIRSQEGNSNIHFDFVADSNLQDDVVAVGKEPTELKFTAKFTGIYHIYDDTDKPSYFRVTLKSAAQEVGSGGSNGLVDVWDFGATQLDPSQYNNKLTENDINSWYADDITPGSAGHVLPDFKAGVLSWVGGGNDRLRTVNTNLTRYDENINDHDDFKGRIYVNSSGKTDRYLRLELNKGDEVTLWVRSQEGNSNIHFDYIADSNVQNDVVAVGKEPIGLDFTAKATGTYHIYDDTDKPSYFRVALKSVVYTSLSGNVEVTDASGLSGDYSVVFTNEEGNIWSSLVNNGSYKVDLPAGFQYNISLEGADGYVITNGTTLIVEEDTATHNVAIDKVESGGENNGLADVWDFGATQLDGSQYYNRLSEEIINSWYADDITPGSSGNVLPSFTAGALSWVGGGNDRLRTSNTNLTRYDENINDHDDFKGRIYVNSSGAKDRHFSLELNEDDEVTIWGLTQNGIGNIHFEYIADSEVQNDVVALGADLTELNFVAKVSGTYHIYDDTDKPSYFRIVRKSAAYASLNGNVDITEASGIPDDYNLVFTNEDGKAWKTEVSNGSYLVDLPVGYQYEISLEGANGYIISNGTTLYVTGSSTTHDINIKQVEIYNVTGSVAGLEGHIDNLTLIFIPDANANSIYVPQPVLDKEAKTYSVQLEPNIEYTIEAEGVNDYQIPENILEITGDTSRDIVFESKPLQDVTIVTNGLTDAQRNDLTLSFTNINESGYSYTFSDLDAIALRDGVYELSASGLDKYPLELAITSNLKVEGVAVSKTLDFVDISNWTFDDRDITAETEFYKGLAFSGSVKNEKVKGHISAGSGSKIEVPLQPGQKMIVTYYYAADFNIDGGDNITTNSGSTSQHEYATYVYPGSESGTAVITINATTYITNIEVIDVVPYSSVLTVGVNKNYQTINGALDAISSMDRPNDERVTVLIDPGNYEEMVVINENNITLKNAASIPGIELANQGVDIASNAVRITSYYGYGYNYFSQGIDNKWNEDVLEVNKANGSQPYANVSGTTNGSYWNATLVVSADGFVAEDLIIENSFNQYISKKESEDVVVMTSGNKGERPTDYGNTSVQNRSFVERAAAIGIASGSDKIVLDNCRVVGRQDSFYGGSDSRVVIYKGAMMGAVDYIFGGMTAVFYKTDFVLNTSDVSGDAAYITAAQQREGRGFLMYETNIISTEPGVNTASTQGAKPGFFGRPWLANTSEVVFYNTNIGVSTYPGFEGKSLIDVEGWRSTLGGESEFMYEYGTVEESGENNMDARVSWSTVLDAPILNDGTEITPFNFTKGNDGWDPLPILIANDDSDNDGILDVDDNCDFTPNPDQADMDNDGIGDVCDDSDGDGLVDSEDECPNSTEGAIVDVFGCEVFNLAADNFDISVRDVSCNGNSDGSITISAADTNYTYNVSVSGTGNGSATLSSSNAFSANIGNLAAGTYDVCITVDEKDGYEQCFRVTIEGPSPLEAFTTVNYANNTVTLSLDGASQYTIEHNGKITTTSQSRVILDLEAGRNKFTVSTDSECQGDFYKEILMSEDVVLYPNPTHGDLKVYINGTDANIDVSLLDISGKEYISGKMEVPSDRIIQLDLTNFRSGVYILLLNSATVSKNLKVIKI